MAKKKIRLAVRDWDYFTPIALGDVRSSDFDVELVRVPDLFNDLALQAGFDGGEYSFSKHARDVADGDFSLFGVPHFMARAFRHRCIITTSKSSLFSMEQLAGKRIGVTGWPDSGNTWTRAILRRAGIEIADVKWHVGRLIASNPIQDRLGAFGRPGQIEAMPNQVPLVDGLRSGFLDAVFTPFMPPGFFEPDSDLRQLIPNCREVEEQYYREVGYVPGVHILCLKRELVLADASLPRALSELFDESSKVWIEKRRKYGDTTPWIVDELVRTAKALPPSSSLNGLDANRQMISDFANELVAQGIVSRMMDPETLFPGKGS